MSALPVFQRSVRRPLLEVGDNAETESPGAALGDVDGLTRDPARVGMTAGRSNCRIMIPGGYNLLENSKQAAADMTLLCAAAEREMLKGVSDRDLSRRVAGATLQVVFNFLCVIRLSLMRTDLPFLFFLSFLDSYFGGGEEVACATRWRRGTNGAVLSIRHWRIYINRTRSFGCSVRALNSRRLN